MFRNYLKTALRNMLRQKSSSVLNIGGLTLGTTCSLILFLLVKHLASYDNYHANRDRIYRVVTTSDGNYGKFYTPGVPTVLPDAFRQDFPEAEEVTFLSYRSNALIRVPQENGEPRKFQEEAGVVFAEPGFFNLFDFPMTIGNPRKALDDPNEAIISRSLAKKYFGREDVIGEVVKHDTIEYRIAAVMEDHPTNTDFPFDLMLSYVTIKKQREEPGWNSIWSDEQCYILLVDEQAAAKVEDRIPAFVTKYLGDDNYRNSTFVLQPLGELHFDDRYSNFNYRTAPREILIALSVVSLFLIITACINFVNLATAEAIKRSKEVGIRKSLGGSRAQLILQFLGETTLVTLTAVLVSLGFTQLALTALNPFMDLSLDVNFSDPALWIFVVGVTLFVSLLSGLYPSFVLSAFNPALALKNRVSNRSSSGYVLRKSLVVVQFVISQFFIMGTIILLSQMNYFQTQDLGFRQDAVVVVPVPEPAGAEPEGSKVRTLREEILRLPGIDGASLSSTPPSSGRVNSTGFYFEGENESESRDVQIKQVDANYLSLYDIELVAGKNLDDSDTARGFVVNEELLRISGIANPADILGKRMHMWEKTLPVVGVIRNFHTVSLRDPIGPTILMNDVDSYRTLSIRLGAGQRQALISEIREKWESFYPEHIFHYEFLDEHIRDFYEGERKMSVILTVFTSIAIFIGCLGLFGLASFMTNQKTKEIGVRKTLGASVESILFLFSKEYIRLVFIGFVFSSPIVWLLMNKWLQNFAYKITIGPLVFVAGFSFTLLIAVLTVGYRSFRAAVVNPVKSLRYE